MARESSLSWAVVGLSVCLVTLGYIGGRITSREARRPESTRHGYGLERASAGTKENASLSPWALTNRFTPYRARWVPRIAVSLEGWAPMANWENQLSAEPWVTNVSVFENDAFNIEPLPVFGAASSFPIWVDPSQRRHIVFDTSAGWLQKRPKPLVDPRLRRRQLKPLILAFEDYPRDTRALGAKADGEIMRRMLMNMNDWEVPYVEPIHELNGPAFGATVGSFLTKQVNRGDVAFLYFAGHGTGARNAVGRLEGFLLPSDYAGKPDFRHAISTTKLWYDLRIAVEERHVDQVVVIIDACQSGAMLTPPFPISEEMDKHIVFITSSSAGQNSLSCNSGSEFTQSFARAMTDRANVDARVGAVTLGNAFLRAFWRQTELGSLQLPMIRGSEEGVVLPIEGRSRDTIGQTEQPQVVAMAPRDTKSDGCCMNAGGATPSYQLSPRVVNNNEQSLEVTVEFDAKKHERVYAILIGYQHNVFHLCNPNTGQPFWPKDKKPTFSAECPHTVPSSALPTELMKSDPSVTPYSQIHVCSGGANEPCTWKLVVSTPGLNCCALGPQTVFISNRHGQGLIEVLATFGGQSTERFDALIVGARYQYAKDEFADVFRLCQPAQGHPWKPPTEMQICQLESPRNIDLKVSQIHICRRNTEKEQACTWIDVAQSNISTASKANPLD